MSSRKRPRKSRRQRSPPPRPEEWVRRRRMNAAGDARLERVRLARHQQAPSTSTATTTPSSAEEQRRPRQIPDLRRLALRWREALMPVGGPGPSRYLRLPIPLWSRVPSEPQPDAQTQGHPRQKRMGTLHVGCGRTQRLDLTKAWYLNGARTLPPPAYVLPLEGCTEIYATLIDNRILRLVPWTLCQADGYLSMEADTDLDLLGKQGPTHLLDGGRSLEALETTVVLARYAGLPLPLVLIITEYLSLRVVLGVTHTPISIMPHTEAPP